MTASGKVDNDVLVCVTCKRTFGSDMRICPDDRTLLVRSGADPNIGTVLSGLYEIVSVLGRGGTSVVYKARHQLMDRLVAIKMLLWSGDALHDEKKIRRFQQEARTTSRLNHPNIATLYDFGVSPQGQPYLVMEYLEGYSLEDLINRQGRIDCDRAVRIFSQICDALEHAHHRGVVHRDMKPSNVIVAADSGDDTVKIVDFGIAELLSTSRGETLKLAGTQQVFGSPYYMSPEQCLNKNVDSRCDIYGLGVALFQALAGTVPFNGETIVEMIHKHVNEPPPAIRDVCSTALINDSMESVVASCLHKQPSERPQSMARLKELLQQAVSTAPLDREARFIRLSRVLIVDDSQGAIDSIKQSLDQFEDVCVVAVAHDGSEALKLVQEHKPEIVLMDLNMPELNGIEATREIKQKLPQSHVVLMAEEENEKDILSALHAGAEGFILKNFDAQATDLPLVLRAVVQGTIWLDPRITSNVLDVYRQSAGDLIGRTAQAPRRQDRSDDMSFLMSLAQSFAQARKFEEAESLYRIALALLERTRKQSHPEVFKACLKLADTYFAQGKMSQAEPLYFQAVEIQTQVLGPEHPHIAGTLEKIGELHYQQKDYGQAERFYYWALSIREKAQPPDHLKAAAVCDKLAELCKQQQKFGQAEQYAVAAEKKRARVEGRKVSHDVQLLPGSS